MRPELPEDAPNWVKRDRLRYHVFACSCGAYSTSGDRFHHPSGTHHCHACKRQVVVLCPPRCTGTVPGDRRRKQVR